MLEKKILVIEGPSGVGKDTIINEMIKRYPDKFARPLNATTRPMRDYESQGNPYLFLSEEEFLRLRKTGEIFEQTIRHGTYRGMRKSSFDEILNAGKIAVKDCDRFGLDALKQLYPDMVLSVFLTADKEEIKRRLISRNEPEESMTARLKDYDEYIKQAIYFDYTIENTDIDSTILQILELLDKN